jgi:hypothetical protein
MTGSLCSRGVSQQPAPTIKWKGLDIDRPSFPEQRSFSGTRKGTVVRTREDWKEHAESLFLPIIQENVAQKDVAQKVLVRLRPSECRGARPAAPNGKLYGL